MSSCTTGTIEMGPGLSGLGLMLFTVLEFRVSEFKV